MQGPERRRRWAAESVLAAGSCLYGGEAALRAPGSRRGSGGGEFGAFLWGWAGSEGGLTAAAL